MTCALPDNSPSSKLILTLGLVRDYQQADSGVVSEVLRMSGGLTEKQETGSFKPDERCTVS